MHHILLYLCSYYSCLSWGLHFTTSTFNNYKWISFVLGVIDVTTNCFIVKISTLIYFAFVHSASPWEYSQEGAGSPSEVKCFCLWSNVNTLRWLPFQNNKNEKWTQLIIIIFLGLIYKSPDEAITWPTPQVGKSRFYYYDR